MLEMVRAVVGTPAVVDGTAGKRQTASPFFRKRNGGYSRKQAHNILTTTHKHTSNSWKNGFASLTGMITSRAAARTRLPLRVMPAPANANFFALGTPSVLLYRRNPPIFFYLFFFTLLLFRLKPRDHGPGELSPS